MNTARTWIRRRIASRLSKLAFAGLLTVQVVAATGAQKNKWWDPNSMFSVVPNFTDEVMIKWHYTDDVQKTCEAESRKRGLGGFGYGVDACSFWYKSLFGQRKCDIYTGKKTNLHFLGHEVRHCFQGNFH